jgi:hypothetical protein
MRVQSGKSSYTNPWHQQSSWSSLFQAQSAVLDSWYAAWAIGRGYCNINCFCFNILFASGSNLPYWSLLRFVWYVNTPGRSWQKFNQIVSYLLDSNHASLSEYPWIHNVIRSAVSAYFDYHPVFTCCSLNWRASASQLSFELTSSARSRVRVSDDRDLFKTVPNMTVSKLLTILNKGSLYFQVSRFPPKYRSVVWSIHTSRTLAQRVGEPTVHAALYTWSFLLTQSL